MARIEPLTIEDAPKKSKDILQGLEKALGFAPNIYRTMGQSPAVLEGFLGFRKSLGGGELSAGLREQIALALAGANTCDYCASAHTVIGSKHGLSPEELTANLHGESADPAVQAVLTFALAINAREGFVTDDQVQALRDAGFSDGQVVEVFAETVANIFTNYFNHLAQTEIDFPLVRTGETAGA